MNGTVVFDSISRDFQYGDLRRQRNLMLDLSIGARNQKQAKLLLFAEKIDKDGAMNERSRKIGMMYVMAM